MQRIHKLLKSAFGKAVQWDYTDKNPTLGVTLPSCHSRKRDVWSDEEAIQALNGCKNDTLRLCVYLALGCSLRMGEILGLQWQNVHIEPERVAAGEAYIRIDRELKLSRGNIKAVQGDTGHAEARMVTEVYSHGFDADRKLIAQEMDSGFFSKVGAEETAAGNDLLAQLVALVKELLAKADAAE